MSQQEISVLNDQAFALLEQGNRTAAKEIFEKVCELDNTEPEARMMLGAIHAELGNLPLAEDCLRQALVLDENYSDAYFYLANVTHAKGDIKEALSLLEKAVEIDDEFIDAKKLFCKQCAEYANRLLQREDVREAIIYFEKLTRFQPENAVNWFLLGRSFGQLELYSEAVDYVNKALAINPNMLEAHFILVAFLLSLGRKNEATYHCDRALELDPDNINAIAMAANLAKRVGDSEKSYQLLSPLLEKGIRDINIVQTFSMISTDIGRQQDAIAMVEDLLASDSTLNTETKSNLYFNLGLLYDNIKKYDEAFSNYQSGNQLKGVDFNQQEYNNTIDENIRVFSEINNLKIPVSSITSDCPIFVVGMVRSGTSLVEQILSSHPDIFGAGELGNIYYYSLQLPGYIGSVVAYPGCISQINQTHLDTLAQKYLQHLDEISNAESRVIDKLPGNFMFLGLIEKLFPNARVINCMRDPVDTCLSAYFQNFTGALPYANDLDDLVCFYLGYLKLMNHWKDALKLPILDINYEDMISEQEKTSRKMINFCGLDWDDRCLNFHESKRFVRTGSYDQVNRPVYQKSNARWKNYERHIDILLKGLNNK